MAKVKVDQEKCIGCQTCVGLCPRTFFMGKDGKSHVKKEEVKDIQCEKEAEKACPVNAITVTE